MLDWCTSPIARNVGRAPYTWLLLSQWQFEADKNHIIFHNYILLFVLSKIVGKMKSLAQILLHVAPHISF